jgi:hypothetical protein
MILQNNLITFGYSAGAEVRSLYCDMLIGQKVLGEVDEELDGGRVETIYFTRLSYKLDNFMLTKADANWLADYVWATDKTINYDGNNFRIVNGPGNYDLEFEHVRGSNARATCDLTFFEAEIRRRRRVTVDGEGRVTEDADTRITT